MPNHVAYWVFGLLIFHLHVSFALISELVIKNDGRSAFHISSFGYEPEGRFSMTVGDFMLMVPHNYQQPIDDLYDIAFVLQRSPSDGGLRLDENGPGICFHKSKLNDDDIVISLQDRKEWPKKHFEKIIQEAGWYHIYFSNCEKDTQAAFTLDLVEYNIEPGTETKVYLSAGEASLPTWLTVICILFVGEIIVWGYVLYTKKDDVRTIHWVMSIVLLFKVFSLFCESIQLHNVKYSGKPDAWRIIYYIINSMKGLLFFSTVVLIGTGYGYLRWFLTDRDRQIMVAVLVVQVMVNIAMVVLDETSQGSAGWLTWRDVLHLLDMICCCVILLPIVWSIRHLRAASSVDGKAAKNMQRLKNFRSFYLLVVCYVYFTRIIVFLLSAILPFELTWLSRVFDEAAAFIFFAMTGWLFRPQASNPYLALDKQEDGSKSPDSVPCATVELSEL